MVDRMLRRNAYEHESGQESTDHGIGTHGRDGRFDKRRLIVDDFKLDIAELPCDPVELGLRGTGHLDRVGAALLYNLQEDAGLAVEPGDLRDVRLAHRDGRNLAEQHGASRRRHADLGDVFKALKLSGGADRHLGTLGVDLPRRQVKVGSLQRLDHGIERDAKGAHERRVQVDMHLGISGAGHRDRSDAADPLQAVFDHILRDAFQF